MNELYERYIRFGTSSWAFEGWQGNVYHMKYPPGRFKRDCLQEYWQDIRFSTVGMDLFFYNPPSGELLHHYARQFPQKYDFKACCKVWQELTIVRFPGHSSWAQRKGSLNPSFLNPDIFTQRILEPHRHAFAERTGPFIFEFQYVKKDDLSPQQFCEKLDSFFSAIPHEFQYSVEVRNKNFLTKDYFDVLRAHKVAHVFNQWSYMPPVREQLKYDSDTADFIIARILTPAGMSYTDSVDRFKPYDKIIERQPAVREDIVQLAEIAVKERKYAYLLINNRIEGSAPETIKELRKSLML